VAGQVPGRLVRVKVREGDNVTAGQVVAEIESSTYRYALDQALAQLAQAESIAKHNDTVVAREQRLFERGISARQQLEAATAAAEQDAAAAKLARAAVDAARFNLEHATIRSPIAGIVLRMLRHSGELVDGTPASAVLEIANPQGLEFAASAAPADLMAIHQGQPAFARFDSLRGRTFPLTVRTVAPLVDSATGVGSVRLVFAPSDAQPPFGLFGEAVITVGEQKNALLVPEEALRNPSENGAEVVVCERNVARVKKVRIGTRTDQKVEISQGVAAGERVAVDNVLGLAEGAPIEVLP
jgi:RND family efflux transporter MFP subunit